MNCVSDCYIYIWVEMLTNYISHLESLCQNFLAGRTTIENILEKLRKYSLNYSYSAKSSPLASSMTITLTVMMELLSWAVMRPPPWQFSWRHNNKSWKGWLTPPVLIVTRREYVGTCWKIYLKWRRRRKMNRMRTRRETRTRNTMCDEEEEEKAKEEEDMYGLSEWNVEVWVEMLTKYIDELESAYRKLMNESSEMEDFSEEASDYSEECSMLCQELAFHVKYDVTLEVVIEDLAWECTQTAALAYELEAQAQEMERLADVAFAHCDVVKAYRDLLQRYLNRDEEEVVEGEEECQDCW